MSMIKNKKEVLENIYLQFNYEANDLQSLTEIIENSKFEQKT